MRDFKPGDKLIYTYKDYKDKHVSPGRVVTFKGYDCMGNVMVQSQTGTSGGYGRANFIHESEAVAAKPAEPIGGQKFDSGKPPFDLLSPIAMLGTAKVLGFGAKKYAAHNWRKGLSWSRIIGAIGRHLLELMMGHDIDKESGLPIVDHLACEVMFLQEFFHTRKDLDDRFKVQEATKPNEAAVGVSPTQIDKTKEQ